MVDVTSRLRLVVDSTGLDRSGRKLKDLRRRARDVDSAARQLRNTFAGLAGVLGAAFSVRQITQVADQYRGIQNQLKLVTGSAQELASVQKQVLAVANETGTSLETTVRLYANLERFAGSFLDSQADTLALTQAINQAAVVSGASVTETSNAIRQLTQGIAGGILRAEEFNSVMENMPRLGQAIADGLGIGIGELRTQVNDGLITSERLIEALQSQFGTINTEFLNASKTIGQAMTALGNTITVELGERLQGAQQVAIDALQWIGANFEKLIPIIEGVAASVTLLAGSFAFSGAVAAVTALLSPLGLLVVAVGAVVAMRDDIAKWAFGVKDAGAVVRAAIDVLTPKFQELWASIKTFVENARPTIIAFVEDAIALFGELAKGIAFVIKTINEAALRIRIEANLDEYERLIERQTQLTQKLREVTENPGSDITLALGSDFDTGAEVIRAQLAEVEKEIYRVSGRINTQIDAEGGFGGLNETLEEIKARAQELAQTPVADEFERTARETAKVASNLDEAAEKAAKLAREARQANNFNIGRSLAGDALDPFQNAASRANNVQQIQALTRGFQDTVDDLKRTFEAWEQADLLSPQELQELREILEDAGVDFGENINDAVQESGNVFARIIRDAMEYGASKFEAVLNAVEFGADFAGGLFDSAKRFADILGDETMKTVDKISAGFKEIGGTVRDIGAAIGGPIGALFQAAGAIGQAIGAAIDFFKGLFSKPSNDAAATQFNLATGAVESSFAKNNNAQNISARDQIIRDVLRIISGIQELTGSSTGNASQIINVGTREIRVTSGAGDASFAPDDMAGALEEAIRQAITLLKGGSKELRDITKALSKAGLPAEEVLASVERIVDITSFGIEPLSEYEQKLKDINDVFDKAIAQARGVADAENALNKARRQAVRSLRRDYNQDIQNQIDEFLDGPLDRLEQLLEKQAKRAQEAEAIGGNLDLVGRLSALELRDFFDSLTEEALNEVSDFLGLFEEASSSVARNLDMSRQDLRARADAFEQFAQQFAQLNTDLTERFLAASPREGLGILRARATELLGEVRGGNESAAQALPQVINQLVENARKTFGNTAGFSDVLAFAQGILRDAENASLDIKSEAERQIEAIDESNDILNDILDILSSSQAFNALMASANAGGVASADALLALIQEGAGLTPANDNASALSITGLIAQSVEPIITPIANSIGQFTAQLAEMPALQRIQIEATNRVEEAVRDGVDVLADRLDRLELLSKKQLTELENAA